MSDDTPSNGHGPPGQRPASVPGGEIGARLHALDVRLTDLDARDTAQHGEVVARLDALTRGIEGVGGEVVAKLDALAAAHQRTVTLRVLGLAEEAIKRALTPTSAPIYAIALLAAVVAAAAVPVVWGDLRVNVDRAAHANADSDDAAGEPASVSGSSAEPSPAP